MLVGRLLGGVAGPLEVGCVWDGGAWLAEAVLLCGVA